MPAKKSTAKAKAKKGAVVKIKPAPSKSLRQRLDQAIAEAEGDLKALLIKLRGFLF